MCVGEKDKEGREGGEGRGGGVDWILDLLVFRF